MRLIDADKWINKLETQMNDKDCPSEIKDYNQLLINEINSEPVAYDEDKVEERLKEKAEHAESKAAEYDEKGHIPLMDIWDTEARAYKNAIEIVKSGRVAND